jgi:DNA polymerase-1
MSAFGLSENLAIPVEEAAAIIKKYFTRFRKVSDYMNDTIETAKRQGYVETLFGRRRYMTELQSKNANIRKFGERAAINAPMQGTAADIVKKAMIVLDELIPDRMTLQVHDELVFEIPKSEEAKIVKIVKAEMESVVKLKVPLKVNVASGLNWDEAH